jgi:hypothetical protein
MQAGKDVNNRYARWMAKIRHRCHIAPLRFLRASDVVLVIHSLPKVWSLSVSTYPQVDALKLQGGPMPENNQEIRTATHFQGVLEPSTAKNPCGRVYLRHLWPIRALYQAYQPGSHAGPRCESIRFLEVDTPSFGQAPPFLYTQTRKIPPQVV